MCEAIFLSEDAPISTIISNFGFTTSPPFIPSMPALSSSLEAIGSSTRFAGGEAGGMIAAAAHAAHDFTCTSLSEAV